MRYSAEKFTGKNGTEYILRSPQVKDAENLLAYLKQAAAETEFLLSYPEEMDFSIKDEEKFIDHYATDKGSIMITAFDGDKLVGNASLSCVIEKKKTLHRATFGIAILKSEWGQGLGKKIVTELISFAKQAGYELLELEVASTNTTAVNLYKKLGFVVYGERPNSLKLKNGEYYGELLMVLDLS